MSTSTPTGTPTTSLEGEGYRSRFDPLLHIEIAHLLSYVHYITETEYIQLFENIEKQPKIEKWLLGFSIRE